MPSEKPLRRLADVIENISLIESFTAGKDLAGFASNKQAVYATLHALMIVSEAARKLGDAAATLVPGQPWADIRSIGSVLRHNYDNVDPEIVWRIIRNGELTSLKQAVSAVLARHGDA